jgi:hypothetical protein
MTPCNEQFWKFGGMGSISMDEVLHLTHTRKVLSASYGIAACKLTAIHQDKLEMCSFVGTWFTGKLLILVD